MPYSSITRLQAQTALAQRLYDDGPPTTQPAPTQFMAAAELNAYINEALQTFNALANFYREEFVFTTVAGQTWYDITQLPGTLRAFTQPDLSLINMIEYHLLEPLTTTRPLVWTGTRQFKIEDLLNAIQQSRDQTLSESGCMVNESLVPAVPGRTFLIDSVMDIRRVCWLPDLTQQTFYTANCLQPSDLWATQSFSAGFPQKDPGTPLQYRRSTEPPVSFDVDRSPAVPGQYDVLTTQAGGPLSISQDTLLNVPDDFLWVVKYGALAQLYGRESLAKDQPREDYCLKRWKQGLAFMQSAPAILGGRINDVPVIVDALSNGDFYNANWQGKPQGQPRQLHYSGLNMLALFPIPDSNGPYSVTVSVVRNMPLPVVDSDYLQVGRDDVDAILDLAQHTALLKVGGAEFTMTFPLFQNFLRHCSLYNSKLKASSLWLEWLNGRPQEEIRVNPIFSPAADPVTVEQK